MKITKLLATVGVAAMMVATLATFTGCNANEANENVIRDSLSEEFDAYKNHDESVVNQIRSQNAVELATLGIDGEEYANALLEGFDYSIDDVAVDGQEATVTLVLTQKELDENEVEALVTELSEDPEFVNMDTEERKTAISDKIFEYINSVEAAPQDPVTIDLVMNGNMWEPTEESAARIQNLFTF